MLIGHFHATNPSRHENSPTGCQKETCFDSQTMMTKVLVPWQDLQGKGCLFSLEGMREHENQGMRMLYNNFN